MRAFHYENDRPVIFADSIAPQILRADERKRLEGWRIANAIRVRPDLRSASDEDKLRAAYHEAVATYGQVISRARFNEDKLEQAIARGVDQYVILGAGFDSFAWRRPDLAAGINVFEIDHPATQAQKRERFARA